MYQCIIQQDSVEKPLRYFNNEYQYDGEYQVLL